MAQFGKQRDGHIKAAQKKLKAARADVEKGKAGVKAAQQRLNEVLAEAEAAVSESSALAEQIKAAQATITGRSFLPFFVCGEAEEGGGVLGGGGVSCNADAKTGSLLRDSHTCKLLTQAGC